MCYDCFKACLCWAEFLQKIWVNYGIGWSEASDANLLLVGAKRVTQTTLQRSGLQKNKKLRVTCSVLRLFRPVY
jgi:hypothetical protein